jgi:hypothetical protein
MGKKVDTSHVVKLEENNYQRWKLKITLVLKASKAWGIVSGSDRCPTDPTNVAEIKAWELSDVRLKGSLSVPYAVNYMPNPGMMNR